MTAFDYPYDPFWVCSDMSEQERIDVLQDLAVHSAELPRVVTLAKTVLSRLPYNADARQAASEALAAVQHLEYHPHPPAREPYGDFFQRPDFTIENGGNCEDLSTVLVAILANIGITAMAVWIQQVDKPLNHVAVQVNINGQWEWADPTIGRARFGESPYESIARLGPTLHPVEAKFRARRYYAPGALLR